MPIRTKTSRIASLNASGSLIDAASTPELTIRNEQELIQLIVRQFDAAEPQISITAAGRRRLDLFVRTYLLEANQSPNDEDVAPRFIDDRITPAEIVTIAGSAGADESVACRCGVPLLIFLTSIAAGPLGEGLPDVFDEATFRPVSPTIAIEMALEIDQTLSDLLIVTRKSGQRIIQTTAAGQCAFEARIRVPLLNRSA